MRRFIVLAGALVVLGVPQPALAGSWIYPNLTNVWWTPNNPSGTPCIWYTDRGRGCSGWDYWHNSEFTLVGGGEFFCPGTGRVFPSFQNNDRIRGIFYYNGPDSDCYAELDVYDTDVGMGGWYMKASSYYWDGTSSRGHAEAYSGGDHG